MAVIRCRRPTLLVAALIINLIILLYLASLQHSQTDPMLLQNNENMEIHNFQSYVTSFKDVTLVIREFEEFENQISNTVVGIQNTLKGIHVVVIGDKFSYPPFKTRDILPDLFHYVSLTPDIRYNISVSQPETFLKTKYIMFIPDSTEFQDLPDLTELCSTLDQMTTTKILTVPIDQIDLACVPVSVDWKRWTVEYGIKTPECNNFMGQHAVFMRTKDLLALSHPYMRPFPESLYLQAAARNWTVKIMDSLLISVAPMNEVDPHHRWKRKHNYENRQKQMYRELGVKLVIQSSGRRLWYGCTRDTTRCFDTIIEDMPEYLYQNRWTPPCCLRALRHTAHYVFDILDSCEARYWLEGGSLLGAARHSDIIPWDYDVDIGIYEEDVKKCDYLRQCSKGPYIDESGYVWEKAQEGNFYRVQYSETNRLHVDIFPFFPINGTMTKLTWIQNHRQDREFPESYLKPLTKIAFAGFQANAPNNVKQFLEFKFGEGVIEHPKYPNAADPD